MIEIKVDAADMEEMFSQLHKLDEKNWNRVLSRAANDTARYLENKYKKELPNYIDRPTRYTMNALRTFKGTPQAPDAAVGWRSDGSPVSGGRHLLPQVYGGDRKEKRFEKALQHKGFLPKGWMVAPATTDILDGHGNVPGQFMVRVLSFLGADMSGTQNSSEASRKKTKYKKRQAAYFVSFGDKHLSAGIYQRVKTGFGWALRKIFTYLRDAPNYEKKFPFFELGKEWASKKFPEIVAREVQNELFKKK